MTYVLLGICIPAIDLAAGKLMGHKYSWKISASADAQHPRQQNILIALLLNRQLSLATGCRQLSEMSPFP